jgi:hypothetical protein
MMIIRIVNATVTGLMEALHKAVPAFNNKGFVPRWRNLGRSITPYHFMQPIPVPVQQKKKA